MSQCRYEAKNGNVIAYYILEAGHQGEHGYAEATDTTREHIALMNVSGALVDSGQVVPEDSVLGGMKSVTWTQVAQYIILDRLLHRSGRRALVQAVQRAGARHSDGAQKLERLTSLAGTSCHAIQANVLGLDLNRRAIQLDQSPVVRSK